MHPSQVRTRRLAALQFVSRLQQVGCAFMKCDGGCHLLRSDRQDVPIYRGEPWQNLSSSLKPAETFADHVAAMGQNNFRDHRAASTLPARKTEAGRSRSLRADLHLRRLRTIVQRRLETKFEFPGVACKHSAAEAALDRRGDVDAGSCEEVQRSILLERRPSAIEVTVIRVPLESRQLRNRPIDASLEARHYHLRLPRSTRTDQTSRSSAS